MENLQVDIAEVESTVAALKQGLSTGDVEEAYGQLISGFSESTGKEAEALRALLETEKRLANHMNRMLTQFATSIGFAAQQLGDLDSRMVGQIGAISVSVSRN